MPRSLGLTIPDVDALQDTLKPGDILLTSAPIPTEAQRKSLYERTYRAVTPRFMGGYGHSALYVGNGTVVEALRGQGVVRRSLGEAIGDGEDVVAVRPDVTPEQREEAVAYAHQQIGRPYDIGRMNKVGLGLFLPTSVASLGKEEDTPKSFICSTLVANAYKSANLTNTDTRMASPVDFLISGKSAPIGVLTQSGSGKDVRPIIGRGTGDAPIGPLGGLLGGALGAVVAKGMKRKLLSLGGVGMVGVGALGGTAAGIGARYAFED